MILTINALLVAFLCRGKIVENSYALASSEHTPSPTVTLSQTIYVQWIWFIPQSSSRKPYVMLALSYLPPSSGYRIRAWQFRFLLCQLELVVFRRKQLCYSVRQLSTVSCMIHWYLCSVLYALSQANKISNFIFISLWGQAGLGPPHPVPARGCPTTYANFVNSVPHLVRFKS